mmetsp:Transcript_12069/g.24657  ORF Transcript_12069/g.24657 Transcript_12069/m.24657 type:complete len:311 (+) Transcript_12069:89-1021(+)
MNKSTLFSSALKKLSIPIGINVCCAACHTALAAPLWLSPLCGAIPFGMLTSRMIKRNDTDSKDSDVSLALKRMYAAGVWCSWATIVGGGLSYIVGMGLSPFCSLVTWAPLIAMESRSSRDAYYGTFGFPIMRILFDWPLTFIGYTLREAFGLRLFSPFATKFDGTIVQGSMPFPSDVKTLVEEYDVVAVVNMCDEYGGPTKEYEKYGVEQLWLRTVDTTVPLPSDLRRGAEFIRKVKTNNKSGRIFVHCKGGIGRASTMSLAHYILNEGVVGKKEVGEKVMWMKGMRKVVFDGVGDYWAIQKLCEEEKGK